MYNQEELNELFEIILKLETIEDCQKFFDDLCTFNELKAMLQRIRAAKLLITGETYESIVQQTNISSTTLSRVSKCVKFGEGYKKFIQ